ncbi:MAG: hypothetical protein WC408_03585 [Candidatus Micrarchaeia archaeon]|jgi:RNase P subunit RPR2
MKRKQAGISGWENSVAAKRIETLLELSKKAHSEGDKAYAKRYVVLARKIAMRHRLKIGSGLFCKSCSQIYCLQGKTHSVRIISGKPYVICGACGKKRMPSCARKIPRS